MKFSEERRQEELLERAHRAAILRHRWHVPHRLAFLLAGLPSCLYSVRSWLRAEQRFVVTILATLCTPLTLVLLHTCGGS